MNKVYKLIWSASQGAWVVCSELGSRQKKGGARVRSILVSAMVASGSFIALPVQANGTCGDGSTATTCDLTSFTGSYDPTINDNKVGQATVSGLTNTLTLTGNETDIKPSIPSLLRTRDITTVTFTSEPLTKKMLFTGALNKSVSVPDLPTQSAKTVSVYDNANLIEQFDVIVTAHPNVNEYIDANFVTALDKGRADVNITENSSNPGIYMAAKQTTLARAETGGSIDWVSKNRVEFADDRRFPDNQEFTQNLSSVTYTGTVNFNGTNYQVTDLASLKDYNNALIAALENGTFPTNGQSLQDAYNKAFNNAFKLESKPYTYKINNIQPEHQLPVGQRWAMAASDEDSVVRVKSGGQLDVRIPGDNPLTNRQGSGGAMLAENKGTAIVENGAMLSGQFYLMEVRDAGSTGRNDGVISAGYYAGTGNVKHDTSGSGSRSGKYTEGFAVTVLDNAEFDNNGVINVAGFNFSPTDLLNYGIKAATGATVRNNQEAVINVAVNSDSLGQVAGMVAHAQNASDADTTLVNDGEIYIGRTAQYEKNALTTEISNNKVAVYGITTAVADPNIALPVKTNITHNGKITVGEKVQNATAVNVKNTADTTTVTLTKDSRITLNGKAINADNSAPLQNIGLAAENTKGATIKTSSTIDINGHNTVGIKMTGNSNVTATEDSIINVNGEKDPVSNTRNYAIYAEGFSDTQKATGTIDGKINLNGVGAIGVHARGYAHVDVAQGTTPKFNAGTDQIGFYIYGENASVGIKDTELEVNTERSTMYRIAEGAKFNPQDLNKITASGKDSVAILGTGEKTNITANDSVAFVLSGEGSNAMTIEGGATGNILSNAKVELTGKNAIIGIANGEALDINNKLDTTKTVTTPSVIHSQLDTTTDVEGITAYVAKNKGQIVYTGTTLNLQGENSTAFKLENAGQASIEDSTLTINNGVAVNGTGGTASEANNFTSNNGTITADTLLNVKDGYTAFTTNKSNVTGAIHTATGATSTVNLNDNTSWTVTDNSNMTALNVANSKVSFKPLATSSNFRDASHFRKVSVAGNYVGNNAELAVNTSWYKDGTSYSDSLVIDGDASGVTQVRANNGIIGDVVSQEVDIYSANVVEIKGNDRATFTGTADTQNAEQAQLTKVPGTKNYAWTLVARPVTPDPVPPVDPIVPVEPIVPVNPIAPAPTPIYKPEVPGYVVMPKVNMEMGYSTLATLHERRGENQTLAWDECGTCGSKATGQTWARAFGHHLTEDGKTRFGYDSDIYGVQFGHDFSIKRNNQGGHALTGVYGAYTRAKTDFNDRFRAENGIISADKYTGKGKSDTISLGLSHTRYAINGSYLDLVGQVSYLHNRYTSRRGISVGQDGWGAALSAEVGRPYALSEYKPTEGVWMIEPQAQLVYQFARLKPFNDDLSRVEQDTQHGLRGRVGFRLAHNSPNKDYRTNTFYATANILHDFISPKNTQIGRSVLNERYSKTWGEVGVGVQLPVGKQAYIYGDARYEHELGGSANRHGYRGTIGVKYTWK